MKRQKMWVLSYKRHYVAPLSKLNLEVELFITQFPHADCTSAWLISAALLN